MSFINKSGSSTDVTIFMILFISSFETISAVIPDLRVFFWIIAPVADASAGNPNGIKTLLVMV